MYKVVTNKCIVEGIYLLEVEAPLIVNKALPGQFVIVMSSKNSERIPLTIYKCDKDSNMISMIYQVVGASTLELTKVKSEMYSIVGPLGKPSELAVDVDSYKGKHVLFVAGGVGIAPIMATLSYMASRGVVCDLIYGAKTKSVIILKDEIKTYAKNATFTTDDGSFGIKGNVVDAMSDLSKYDVCLVIGPVVMMKYVSIRTKEDNLKTIVSMNPIMVDGTGMCGACRLVVDGKVLFACVDGPEFDGHKVDFDLAIKRMNIYKTIEGRKYLEALEGSSHHGGCGVCDHE